MRRLFLGAAAIAAAITSVVAWPASAEESIESNAGIITQTEQVVYSVANRVLSYSPMPDDWQRRHVCVIVDRADRSWCLYFPWPI